MISKPNIEVWFELENRCNLKCKFCYNFWKNGEHIEPKSLSAKELIICLENLFKVVQCDKITLSGGEPLLRRDLFTLIDFIKSKGIPMVLTSNGLLLDKEKIKKLKESGVVTFEVPLHSMDKEVHNYLSGANCFDESLNSLLILKELKCNVIPVFVATRKNINHFYSVLNTCFLLNIRKIIFNRFIPSGFGSINAIDLGVPSDEEVGDVLMESYTLAKDKKIEIYLGVPVNLPVTFSNKYDFIIAASCPVKVAQKRWTIDAGGNLRRCNHSHLTIGNLLFGGEDILAQELTKIRKNGCGNDYHPCQFIETERKFELSVL